MDKRELVINEPALEGKIIYLEGLSEKYVSQRYADWLNNKEVCRENRHGSIHNTIDMTKDYVNSVDKSDRNAVFAIITKGDNRHIGNISLNDIVWENNSGEISILVGEKDCWGRGIATEAYRLVIDYGFNMIDLHRIKSGMTIRNKAMMRVAEKACMIKEGIFRDAFFKDGEYIDVVQYAIINPKHKGKEMIR